MKNKIKYFLSLVIIFSICSCSKVDYSDNVDIDNMSLIQLNDYKKYLEEQNQYLENRYNNLIDLSDGKTKEELIELMNYVNNEVIKSNVMITNESKSFFHTSSVSSGSGTIIKEDSTYYYVLTNNHVIYSLGRNTLYVYDYLNNEYNATLLFNNANYDMALLRFSKTSLKLKVSELAKTDVEVGKNIIAIGQPNGQRNAITFGEVLYYDKVNCSDCNLDESNINYECVYYDAVTTNGNSGGMLIDYNYNLVGVVTYGMSSYNGEYVYGAGSPVNKIREFLSLYDFKVGENND